MQFSRYVSWLFYQSFADSRRSAEGGIWTLAPLLTTYSLSRGAPSTTWVLLQVDWCLNSQITGKDQLYNSTALLDGVNIPSSRIAPLSWPARRCLFYLKPFRAFFFFWTWHPPIFPCRLQHSIFGRLSLNRRVRDGNGCFPWAHRHQDLFGFSWNLNSI